MFISWLDTGLVLLLGYQLIQGWAQGGLASLRRILHLALLLFLVLWASPLLAPHLAPALHCPLPMTTLGLMLALAMLLGATWRRLPPIPLPAPFSQIDRVFGLFVGGAWGVVVMVFATWLYSNLLGPLPAQSPLGQTLYKFGEKPVNSAISHIPPGFPNILVTPEGWELVAFAPSKNLPPTQLEREMLVQVNQARIEAKLKPLAWNGSLASVARHHSQDMLKHNYFAHKDPQGHDVSYRVSKAGIPYLLVGENLAYAPDLKTAHRGLMRSPGHRANILRSNFKEVGIGILRVPAGTRYAPAPLKIPARPGSLLVTQVFRG